MALKSELNGLLDSCREGVEWEAEQSAKGGRGSESKEGE